MRVLVHNYTFNKTTKEITFTDYASIVLEKVLLVTDVTNNTTIYQANDSAKGGSVATNVLTLTYDTTGSSFNNSDKLQIFYEADVETDGSQKTQVINSAGTAVSAKTLSTQVAGTDVGIVANTVIHGNTGSGYVDVKATAAGAIVTDGSAVTQPVSATSLPLPTGAATAAKQPALGTAGSAASDVITVQGIASMTPIKVDGSAVTQPVSGSVSVTGTVTANLGTIDGVATETTLAQTQGSSTGGTAATKSNLVGAVYNSSAPTLTNGQQAALQLNSSGGLKVDGSAVTQPISAASLPLPTGAATSAKQPAIGTAGTPSADVISVQGAASMTPVFVEGSSASGTALSDNPVVNGGLAKTANPTAVADGQTVHAMHDKLGRQIVVPGHVRDLVTNNYVQITTATETTILAAGAAGVFHDLTSLVITNSSNQAISVTIRDATAGTTRMLLNVAANGGVVFNPTVPLKQATAANNWTAQLSVAATVNFTVIAVKNI